MARTRFSVVSWVICHVLPPFVPALYLESVRTGHATENIWLTFVIMGSGGALLVQQHFFPLCAGGMLLPCLFPLPVCADVLLLLSNHIEEPM